MPTKKQKLLQAIKSGKVKDATTASVWVQIEELKNKIDEELPNIKNIISKVKGDKGEIGPKGDKGESGKDGKSIIGPKGQDGKDGETPDENQIVAKATKQAIETIKPLIPEILDLEKEIPQLGHEIRDGLELLTKDERLDWTSIKGIDDYPEISKLARQPRIIGGGGGSIARNFYQLFDVPQSYAGQTGKYLKVNTGETGLEFGSVGGGTWGSITGTLSAQTDLQTALNLAVPYTGATADVDLVTTSHNLSAYNLTSSGGNITLGVSPTSALISGGTQTADNEFTLPDASGTFALTSDLSSYVPYAGATAEVVLGQNLTLGDDKYLYFDTTKTIFIRYSDSTELTLPPDVSSITYLALYANTGADGLGTWLPCLVIADDGIGIETVTGHYAYLKADNISIDKTFQFPDATGTLALGTGTINEIAYWAGANTLGTLAVATYPSLAELAYVKGVTSAIQTQINAKQASDTQLTSLAGLSYTGNSLKVVRVNVGETDFELSTIAGGGDVSKVGTPANNQVGVWTGDGTLEGDAALTFDTTTDTLATTLITATTVTANLTGNVTGNASGTAATVTGAAQAAITSLGTLTTLTVDDITINGNTISSAGASSFAITPTAGQAILLDGTISIDAGQVTGITSLGVTGTRVTAGFFTDLTVTNAITGSITGNAGTVTTITGLAPDIATTQATQPNITSLGTLTILTVDDILLNGKVITMTGSTDDTTVITAGTNGTLSIVTTDTAAAAANIQITADGTVDIDSAGVLTLDSGAAINIEPAVGSAILLDGTISVDAGVITGATSITSTTFVGALTGTASGNLTSGGALGTPSSGTGTNITGIPAANILAGSFGAGAYVISTSLQAATIELGAATDTTLSRVSAGVVAIEGVNILTTAGGTLTGNITLGEGVDPATIGIVMDASMSADERYSGITVPGTAGAVLAFGDLCYLDVTVGEWLLADADAAATAGDVPLGICVDASTDGAATSMLLVGTVRSAAFPASIALGAPVYVSTTAGDIQTAMPTGTDDVIRRVGWAITVEPNSIYFNPSNDYVSHV